ncbi:zinc finger BED domain-containing protein RICESLEEPER 2-like [Ipomoea triloba]|uniref:zinc finger BED domain-containing protein RICESLEEPER 2-like n=1 Tax=Ipomoea triloba TaxID=35885 RepID=UPI00125D4B98|nr:zinc finger BED domain-containing protein RICESLEEPER 2-like [Ipomoea triloba]
MTSGSFRKKISFVPVSSHRGEFIAKALESCLLEWEIRNVFTVIVDNVSSNDTALGFFKNKLLSWGSSSVRVQYMHMRCIAHILNLVVQDGLRLADVYVKRVRDVVRWVRNSPARLKKFRDLADLIGVEAKSALQLDVPTRSLFSADLCDSVPSYLDWCSMESLVKLLKKFYEMTVRISGSLYVTSNTFFSEISDLSFLLEDMVTGDSGTEKVICLLQAMGTQMKQKFEKYWGGSRKNELCHFFANILDPRDKEDSTQAEPSTQFEATNPTIGKPQSRWWKVNSERFSILSKVARDVLAVPISIVASESAFCISGRVLDAFRSSLIPKIVKVVLRAQDCLRLPNQPILVDENLDEVERLEKEFSTGVASNIPLMLHTIPVIYDHAFTLGYAFRAPAVRPVGA